MSRAMIRRETSNGSGTLQAMPALYEQVKPFIPILADLARRR